MINKHIKIGVGVILGVAILIGFFSFNNSASAESCDSRTITGDVNTYGTPTNARFTYGTDYYSVSQGYGTKTPVQTFYSDGNISEYISGLSPNTQYFYNLEVTNYLGSDLSATNNFTTPSCDDGGGNPPPAQTPTGNISATPQSCTAPCKIDLSWNSQNVATVVRVYRDGQEWVTDNANMQGSATDWNVGVGSHEYCLRAVDANWSVVSGNLDCDTVTVTAQVAQNPTATISSTQNCTAPCDVNINWDSSNVGSIVRIYRNNQVLWNQTANVSGSEKDWGMQAGTYRYCIRAVNDSWSESGDLNCSTTTVTAEVVQNPTATISSTPSCVAPCNVIVSWTSSNVSRDSNVVKIYKNGQFIWNQNGNTSGTETEWSLPQGTYRYCVRAVKSDWSETGDLACFTSTVTAAPIQNLPMSGTLTPATNSCAITSGSSSCPITFSWNTVNPVALSSVISNGTTLATGNAGNSSFSIPRGSKTFLLYNNGISLDHKIVSAECASGLVWDNNNGTCKTTTNPPAQTCQDYTAINYGGTLPCRYHTNPPVNPPVNPPIYLPVVTIYALPTSINYNGSSQITWNSFNATSCTGTLGANSWTGNKSLNGTWNTGALTATTTYNIICYNSAGTSVNAHTTVTVGAQPVATCQDTTALNYGGALPCNYHPPVVQNPTVNISANPMSINYNGSSLVTWNSTNATSCVGIDGSNDWNLNSLNTSGTWHTGALRNTVIYTISCTNQAGVIASAAVTITVGAQPVPTCQDNNAINYGGTLPCRYPTPTCQDNNAVNYGGTLPCKYPAPQTRPIVGLTIDDSEIAYNTATIVRWSSQNADSCFATNGANGWTGARNLSGNFPTGQLTVDKTYTITCSNSVGSDSKSATVRVGAVQFGVPVVTLTADDLTLDNGGNTFIRWTSTNANLCFATAGSSGWSGTRILSGNFYTGRLTTDTTYGITCTNNVGSDSKLIVVRVNNVVTPPGAQAPTVTLTADQSTVSINGNTTLRWASTNATSCTGNAGTNGWSGSKTTSGTFNTGALRSNTTYNITCVNSAGVQANATITVNVRSRFFVITL